MGFQVPRVTINIDFKEGTSFGELSIISLGYGLHQAWIYSSMFDKGGIFGTSGLQAGPFNDQLSLAYFVSILVYGLLLLVASVLDTRLIRPLHATPTLVIAALLGSTGTLLLLAPDGSLLSSEALQLASGVLTGAGSSVLLLAWGIAFSRRDSASVVTNGALSIAIGFGIYGLVLHQIPFPWGGVASALIPFAEIALLLVLRRHVSLDFDNRQLIFQPLERILRKRLTSSRRQSAASDDQLLITDDDRNVVQDVGKCLGSAGDDRLVFCCFVRLCDQFCSGRFDHRHLCIKIIYKMCDPVCFRDICYMKFLHDSPFS